MPPQKRTHDSAFTPTYSISGSISSKKPFTTPSSSNSSPIPSPKKRIYLNAFDTCSVGHTSPGQWRNPRDRSSEKRDLAYWIETAKTLERGKFSAYFLADTVGGFEVYKGSRKPAIKIAEEFPLTDPFVVSLLVPLFLGCGGVELRCLDFCF